MSSICASSLWPSIEEEMATRLWPGEGQMWSAPDVFPHDAQGACSGITNSTQTGQDGPNPKPKVNPIFCDKLSITASLDEDQLQEATANLMKAMDQGWGKRRGSRLYKYSASLSPGIFIGEQDPASMRIDLGARNVDVSDFRMELNPAKCDVCAAAALASAVLPGLGDHLLEHGKVTRMDLAVDVGPISFADVGLAVSKTQVSQAFWGADGALETLYWGAAKNFVVYDKLRESTPLHMVPKDDPPPTMLRFEARYKPSGLALHELPEVPNLFSRFRVCGWPGFSEVTDADKFWVTMFMDSGRQRGITAALKLLPPTERKQMQRRLEKHATEFWDAESIWAGYAAVAAQILNLCEPASPVQLYAPMAAA
jgi:hypothetical protein